MRFVIIEINSQVQGHEFDFKATEKEQISEFIFLQDLNKKIKNF